MKILLGLAAALLSTSALAADMSVKAPIAASPVSTCTNLSCSGFFAGAEISGAGSGVNVLNLASLNSGGTSMGVNGGYQFFNGLYWLGAKVALDYDVSQQNPSIGGASVISLSKLFAFEGVEVGGNLTQMFGLQAISLPGFLSTAVPTVLIGACQHGNLNGYCAGAAAHFFIPNSRFTVDVNYLNAQYNQTSVTGAAGLPATISTENRGTFGFSYHF